jgi:peptidyl-tRNA hydrolase, PTH1 family
VVWVVLASDARGEPGHPRTSRAMKLFVGLGNPGDAYARHRHNVGFMAIEAIASRHGFGPWKKKFQGLTCEGTLASTRVVLLKPQTFMNDSGRSVSEAARFLKIPVGDVIVFYDEIDLTPGKLRAKVGGGNAGHNGLRSLSAHLDNDYARVRIGVGHPGEKHLVAGYVLHDFAKADRIWLDPLIEAIADTAPHLASGDLERFLADVARSVEPAKTSPRNDGPPTIKPPKAHPAGERANKRGAALADNIKKWLAARKPGA